MPPRRAPRIFHGCSTLAARLPWRRGLAAAFLLLAGASLSGGTPASAAPPLRFSVADGLTENHFLRAGPVAAHLVLTPGAAPRVIFAFPAGNTGAGLWFEAGSTATSLTLAPGTELEPVQRPDGSRGVRAHLRSDASRLVVRHVLLANIRSLREFIWRGAREVPAELAAACEPGAELRYRRASIDGRTHQELTLAGETGTRVTATDDGVVLEAGPTGRIDVRLTALTDEPPLTPFRREELFRPGVAPRPRDQDVFEFLAFHEKLAAGSWRFLTYFGRDTLLTTRLLLPVLQPAVAEAAFASVLDRLGPAGEVAHEEGIGEYAALHNRTLASPPADTRAPELDYKMVDGDFLLAPTLAAYLLDTPDGVRRAPEFLARHSPDGATYAALLRRNLDGVLRAAAPFAADPRATNLVALKPGVSVGNWRDSDDGLGGGRYAYDVNAALVPAALRAAERFYRSGWLGEAAAPAAQASASAAAWRGAEKFFRCAVPRDTARAAVADYSAAQGLDPAAALASVSAPVEYHALALDAAGAPVPVMHSDEGFAWLFGEPAPEQVAQTAELLLRPFPAGLLTDVGIVVANPVWAAAPLRAKFTRDAYHGTVVWSWQQALLAAGLRRQLARGDLSTATRDALVAAEARLWRAIAAMQARSTGELWSWEPRDGRAAFVPYGLARSHADESNAAQLWSTVYLAVRPSTDAAPTP